MEPQVMENPKATVQGNRLEKLKVQGEWMATVLCGILIFFGWLLKQQEFETLSATAYILSFLIGGFAKAKEGIVRTIRNKELNVELLMILAAVGSAIVGYWTEGAVLIFIFALSGTLESYTLNKSRREISSLMDLQPEDALLINAGMEKRILVSQLVIGDLILIKPGERLPADGVIINGTAAIDESAITGESMPITKETGSEVFAGTVNINGSITVEITKPTNETLFHKIIELVQNAQSEKSPSQLFIERFEGQYVKGVLLTTSLMLFLPHYLLGWGWNETFYRAMVLLVVASPCALVASIMPATLSAISNGARRGILFKGGIHLENLSHLQAIAFDKTGTLTKGEPVVTDIIAGNTLCKEEVLLVAASIEYHSNHPLANAIVKYAKERLPSPLLQPERIEDVAGWGVKAVLDQADWKIGKAGFVGKDKAMHFADGAAVRLAEEGKTIVFLQKNDALEGVISLKDVVREETKAAINQLKKQGIYTVMVTGDSMKTAQSISSESDVHEYVAECLPENKVEYVKRLREKFGNIAMVGDGINDAPALATANVGIAMGGGTDVALETADIVLMKNNLLRIAEAIQLSKRMNKIIKQNIIFSITIIVFLISSNFLQAVDLPLGVIGHEGSTILVILNGLRLLK